MPINININTKYIIKAIAKTSIGLYQRYFSKVFGKVIYSEIFYDIIIIFDFITYNVNSLIF